MPMATTYFFPISNSSGETFNVFASRTTSSSIATQLRINLRESTAADIQASELTSCSITIARPNTHRFYRVLRTQ